MQCTRECGMDKVIKEDNSLQGSERKMQEICVLSKHFCCKDTGLIKKHGLCEQNYKPSPFAIKLDYMTTHESHES